jgi:DnaK suppressor protein
MRKDQVKKFKRLLEGQKLEFEKNTRVLRDEFAVSTDDRFDEVDQAAADSEQSMRMRFNNREVLYYKKVIETLKRIDDGRFGECLECGEDIEVRRLMARPTATHCVSCKEEQEKREVLTAAGRLHKSLGEAFSRRFA